MLSLRKILQETVFNNWKKPSLSELKLEFKVEHELKRKNYFESEEDFLEKVKHAKIETITPSTDNEINNRSQTSSYEDLLNLIKSYKSYPEFRNEKTLTDIYDGFKNNKPMTYPIVIDDNGYREIFSGNTRMDVAFQLGINPKVLIIKL